MAGRGLNPKPVHASDRIRQDRAGQDRVNTRYALLIRGVNIGTKNSLPMAELRSMLDDMGCEDVQTYVQSGNAVFATKLEPVKLTKIIETALERYMGRPIATTLRTEKQMRAIVNGNPFGKIAANPSNLCVTFLANAPRKVELASLYAKNFSPELFHVSRTEIYSWHPNGQGKSPLCAAFEKLPLRGAVTRRNWNTVERLLRMLGEV